MKKAVTRILSLFLIVTMLTSADVFSVFAENGEAEESAEGITPHSGVDGDLTWSIDENGVLRITGVGDYENGDWKEYSSDITSAVVDVSGLTSTWSMFGGCGELKTIEFINFDTKNVIDMSNMFDDCEQLQALDVSGFDTQNVEDMSFMFSGCSQLSSIDVSNFNTRNVKNMHGMFMYCSELCDIDVSNFDTGNVTSMGSMFSQCNKLKSVNVSNFNTQNVEDMSFMFGYCSQLSSIDVSNFNTKSVTFMSGMFIECSQLSSIDVSNFNTQNVDQMAYMFEGCRKLSILNVSSFETKNVTTMSGMFERCSQLSSIDVSNFDTQKVVLLDNMFRGCTNLKNIDVRNFNTESVQSMTRMFEECESLINIDISNFNMQTTYDVSDMFSECDNLAKISVPANIPGIIEFPYVEDCIWRNQNNEICTEIAAGLSSPMTYTRTLEDETPGGTTDPEAAGLMLTSATYKYGTKSVNLLSTAHVIETSHREFDLICTIADDKNATKFVLYSGNAKIAESMDGRFKKVDPSKCHSGEKISVKVYGKNKVVTTQLLLKIKEEKDNFFVGSKLKLGGEGTSFKLDDDVPFIGGRNIDMNFPDIPINAVVEDGKIKIGFNIKKSELFSYNSNEGVTTTRKKKSIKQKINDWKKKVKEMEYTRYKADLIDEDWKGYLENGNLEADMPLLSGKINFTAFGYAEGEWSDSLESISGELVVAISASATMQKQFVILQIPVTVNCKTSWKLGGDATLKYDFIDRKWSGDFGINADAAIEPYVGVGVGTWVSLGIYGQIKMGADATLITVLDSSKTPGIDDIYLSGEVGVKCYFAKKEVERIPIFSLKNLKNTNWGQYINDKNQFLIYSRTQNSVVNKKSARNLPSPLSDEIFAWSDEQESVYYGPRIAGTGDQAVTLVGNAYGAAEPQVVTAGDTTLVAYLDNEESRALPNQTVVKYIIYNPVTGTFSEPEIVLDDDTADYRPRLYTDGTNIYVYYLDSTKVYGEGDDPGTSEYAGTFAVTVAKYDADSGNFTKLGTMSRGNHYCYAPILTNRGDGLLLAWAENDSSQVFGLTQDNSVNYSIYRDGSWSEPQEVAKELNSVTSIAVGELDGMEEIAYCVDVDNDLTTAEQQLYLADESGTVTKCLEDAVSNLQFIQLPEQEQSVLAFNRLGNVSYINAITGEPQDLFEEAAMGAESPFMIDGNRIYYLKSSEENARKMGCMVYSDGKWRNVDYISEPGYVDNFSVFDGKVVYILTDADVYESSDDIVTTSKIKFLDSYEKNDLSLVDASFDELNLVPDGDLPLTLTLANHGTKAVENPVISFCGQSNSDVQQKALEVSLAPGEVTEQEVVFKAPVDFEDAAYTLEIQDENQPDSNVADNRLSLDLSKTELDVATEYRMIDGGKYLAVIVENTSNIGANANVEVADADKNLMFQEQQFIPANETVEFLVEIDDLLLDAGEEAVLTASASSDREEYYTCNNVCEQSIWDIEIEEPVVSDIESDHTHSYQSQITTQPGCTKAGVKTFTCSGCGDSYTETIPAAGHKYTKATQNPTCTVKGAITYTCSVCKHSYKEEIPAAGHKYTKTTTKATCTAKGAIICTCTVCRHRYTEKVLPAAGHKYVTTKVAATMKKNGTITTTCKVCKKKSQTVIYAPRTVALSKTESIYTGKQQKPKVTVKNQKGKKLKKGRDYTIFYQKNMKKVGMHTVIVKFKGNYRGKKKMYFVINPRGTSLSKATPTEKGFDLKWKKQAKEISGYEVAYSTSNKFTSKSTKVVTAGKGKTSTSVTGLKAKKKYHVRIRTYKKVKGKKYYSDWSKAKSVKTKK